MSPATSTAVAWRPRAPRRCGTVPRPKKIAEASRMPHEADTPPYPGQWHLVYENLSGTDELFRLRFDAELGRPGFMRPPFTCQSDAIAWTEWLADHWQRLRNERAKAMASCTRVLAGTPGKFR
jgi:hypothetical protein